MAAQEKVDGAVSTYEKNMLSAMARDAALAPILTMIKDGIKGDALAAMCTLVSNSYPELQPITRSRVALPTSDSRHAITFNKTVSRGERKNIVRNLY